MAVRGVILDIDGTLIDSNDAHARAFAQAFAASGYDVPFETIRPLIGMGSGKVLERAAGLSNESQDGGRIDRERRRIFQERYLPDLRAWPGAKELLERLQADGRKLVTASSAEPEVLQKLLRTIGAEGLIDAVAPATAVQKSKPDPDVVLLALERSELPASEVVMLGDTPYDVEAAHRAGVASIALRCGGWSDRDLSGAAAVYQDPADLLARYHESPLAPDPPQTTG